MSTILITAALDDLRARNIPVTNLCPAVEKFLETHADYRAVIDSAAQPDTA